MLLELKHWFYNPLPEWLFYTLLAWLQTCMGATFPYCQNLPLLSQQPLIYCHNLPLLSQPYINVGQVTDWVSVIILGKFLVTANLWNDVRVDVVPPGNETMIYGMLDFWALPMEHGFWFDVGYPNNCVTYRRVVVHRAIRYPAICAKNPVALRGLHPVDERIRQNKWSSQRGQDKWKPMIVSPCSWIIMAFFNCVC